MRKEERIRELEKELEELKMHKIMFRGKELHPKHFAKIVAHKLWTIGYTEAFVRVPDTTKDLFVLELPGERPVKYNAEELKNHVNAILFSAVML